MPTLNQMAQQARERRRIEAERKAAYDAAYFDKMWPGGIAQQVRAWLTPETWRRDG